MSVEGIGFKDVVEGNVDDLDGPEAQSLSPELRATLKGLQYVLAQKIAIAIDKSQEGGVQEINGHTTPAEEWWGFEYGE